MTTAAWPMGRLGEVCDIVSGATPKTNDPSLWDGDICWVTPKDLSEVRGKYIGDTPRKLTEKGLRSSSATVLPAGSVLLSSRAPIGLVAINTVPMATNQGFKSLIPRPDRVDAGYLYRWVDGNRRFLQSLGRGATFTEISKAITADILLPLPAIDEQRRIAAVLDQADDLRAKRQTSVVLLDSLNEAMFRDMFGIERTPPVTAVLDAPEHPAGWRWETLTDVARLATGHTPDRSRPEYWNGDIPWINLTEIRGLDGRIADRTDLTISDDGIRNSSAVLLPPGTVCCSRTASIGFVTVMGREMSTSQDFVNWVCGDRLDPIYLMRALIVAREGLRALSTGSTHKTVYMRVAEQLRVLVPPIELQRRFTARVKATGQLGEVQDQSALQLDNLYESLQHRAFAGQL